MLSDLRVNSDRSQLNINTAQCEIRPDDRYSHDVLEDMKSALELLFKFKVALDKLHPECIRLIEKMLAPPQRY